MLGNARLSDSWCKKKTGVSRTAMLGLGGIAYLDQDGLHATRDHLIVELLLVPGKTDIANKCSFLTNRKNKQITGKGNICRMYYFQ